MKFSLARGQVIALAAAGLLLSVASVLGWLGLGGLMEKTDAAQQLAERRGKTEIAEIIGKSGGMGTAKKEISQLDQLAKELTKKEESILGPWRAATLEATGEGKDWSKDPNRWKDQLVKYNDELLKRAGKSGSTRSVVLGTNFYLGFEDFKQKSPREDQVNDLALQLSVSKRLVDLLFQAKESSREGYPTSCLLIRLQGPASQQGEVNALEKPRAKEPAKNAYKRDRYNLELACSPEVLYSYLQALVTNPYFFIPINLAILNEKEAFPKRSDLAAQFASGKSGGSGGAEDSPSGGSKAPPALLKVLAGDEKIKVSLQVDFVSFKGVNQDPKKIDGKTGSP